MVSYKDRFALVKDRFKITWSERRMLRRLTRRLCNAICRVVDDRDHMVSNVTGEFPRTLNHMYGHAIREDGSLGPPQTWKVLIIPYYCKDDEIYHLFPDSWVRRHADQEHRDRQ